VVVADEARGHALLVEQRHVDLRGAAGDVEVREDAALVVDDHARADAAVHRPLALGVHLLRHVEPDDGGNTRRSRRPRPAAWRRGRAMRPPAVPGAAPAELAVGAGVEPAAGVPTDAAFPGSSPAAGATAATLRRPQIDTVSSARRRG
jgi:hypothetical protein